MDKLVVF